MMILYTDVAVTNMDVLTVTTFTLMEAWLMPKCTGNDQTIFSLRNCLIFGDRSDHIWWQRHQLLPNDVHWDIAKLYGIENVRVTAWLSQLKPICHESTEQGNSQNLSLRHYLLAQSQRHHTTNGLEERGMEKKKGYVIVLERTREGQCHSDEHWNFFQRQMNTGTVSKATLGKLSCDGVESIIMGFSEKCRHHLELNQTELTKLVSQFLAVLITAWQ